MRHVEQSALSTGRARFWLCLWLGVIAPLAGLAVTTVTSVAIGLLAAVVCAAVFLLGMLARDGR